MTQEYLDRGGSITRIEAEEMPGGLEFGKRDSAVAKQVPWLGDAVSSQRREDREFRFGE